MTILEYAPRSLTLHFATRQSCQTTCYYATRNFAISKTNSTRPKKFKTSSKSSKMQQYSKHMTPISMISANIPKSVIKQIGQHLDETLINCRYKGRSCNFTENFVHLVHPLYLGCFTSKDDGKPHVGPESGLSIIFKGKEWNGFTEYDSFHNVGNTRTIRIHIHEVDTAPLVGMQGLDLLPGISTSIGITQKYYKRLGDPYAGCSQREWVGVNGNEYKRTIGLCKERCLFQHILSKCNCVTTKTDIYDIEENKPYCLAINLANISDTVVRATCEIHNHYTHRTCSCKWNCEQTSYSPTTSQALWPHKTLVTVFFLNISNHYRTLMQ